MYLNSPSTLTDHIGHIHFYPWDTHEESWHRIIMIRQSDYYRIQPNRCIGSCSYRNWLRWMCSESHLHQSTSKSILSRLIVPMFWKLYCPPLKDVSEGRSIHSSPQYPTSHRHRVSVVVWFLRDHLASVTTVSLKCIVSQLNRLKRRQVWFISSFSPLLSIRMDWMLWNTLLPILILCSIERFVNSRFLYFMNAYSPISMLLRFAQFVTRSLPLPPLNPPLMITTLCNAANPFSSITVIPFSALIPILRFFMDCCWFNIRFFCFATMKFAIHKSSISLGIPFNSAWFRITILDDGTDSLKLI